MAEGIRNQHATRAGSRVPCLHVRPAPTQAMLMLNQNPTRTAPADPPHRTSVARTAVPNRKLRLHEVQQIVPYSNVHLTRLEQAGKFPRRIKFGPGRVVWDEDEVLTWVEARRAESNAIK